MEKEKEKIKAQIIKSIGVYRGINGITFFDSSKFDFISKSLFIDNNDTEVLLIEINDSDWILITTKCIFIHQNNVTKRTNGIDIEKFEFVNLENGISKENRTEFENSAEYKKWLNSGGFRITKKDNNTQTVNLPNHDLGFCLLNTIKKLKFVSNKYIGI